METKNVTAQKEPNNKEIVQCYWDGKWNKRNLAILDELQTPGVLYHGPAAEMKGRDEYKDLYSTFLSAFHDTEVTVMDLVAEGEKVVSRVQMRGTHKGALEDLPPTGKTITFEVITIFRLEDGKIAEEWEAYDELKVMQQLGMELRLKEATH